jgi:DnaJ-class molecular chaperone
MDITLKQAILGDVITVPTLHDPLKVRVQAGTQPNTLVRLRSKGIRDINGYGVGDFFIRLNITIPTSLTRHDRQLLEQLNF